MKVSLRILALLSLMGWTAQLAASMPIPNTLNYQGRLKTGGSPVPDGSHYVTFRLYDDPSAGANVWSEFYNGTPFVTTVNGLFNVTLGSLIPLPASTFNQALWLQIEWYNTTTFLWETLSPRHELTRAPYAFSSKTFEAGAVVTGAVDVLGLNPSGAGVRGLWVQGSSSGNGIEATMSGLPNGYSAIYGNIDSGGRSYALHGYSPSDHWDSAAVLGRFGTCSILYPNIGYGHVGAAGIFVNGESDGLGLLVSSTNALSSGKGIGIVAEGWNVGVSATAKDISGFGVGVWGIVPGYGGGVAGVIGQIHGDSTAISRGRGGVVAVNSKLSVTNGSPAVALFIDGAIAVNSARADRSAGVIPISSGSFSSVGTNTLSATSFISSASIKSNSLIYLTVSSGSAVTADVVSVRLTSVVDGTANFRLHIMRGAVGVTSASVDVHYLIINR